MVRKILRSFIWVLVSVCSVGAWAQDGGSILRPPDAQKDEPKLTAKEAFAKFKGSVVEIVTTFKEKGKAMEGSGTGFFYLKDFLVVTAYHVVSKANTLAVKDTDGNALTVTELVYDKAADLAVLRLSKPTGRLPLQPIAFADLPVGEPVFVIGNSLGILTDSLSSGIVSGKRTEDDIQLVQMTAAISHGNSGGPVITETGKVAGVVRSYLTEGQALNMAVSVDMLTKVAQNKTVSLETFTRTNTVLGDTKKEGDPQGVGSGPTGSDHGEWVKQARNRFGDLFGRYRKESARTLIVLFDAFNDPNRSSDFAESIARKAAPMVESIRSMKEDETMIEAMIALETPLDKFGELRDRLDALENKWVDYLKAEVDWIAAANANNKKALDKGSQESTASLALLSKAEDQVADFYKHQSWFDDKSIALPDSIYYLTVTITAFRALPDPDFDKGCVVACCIDMENGLKRGDEILGIRPTGTSTFYPAATWKELDLLLYKYSLKGNVVVQVRRGTDTLGVNVKLGDYASEK